MRNMKKGISPLVAAVLLIAATMSIAGILAYWAASYVRERTTAMGNETYMLGRCSGANFGIYSRQFRNSTPANNVGNLTITLENKATYTVYITGVTFIWPDGSVDAKTVNVTLSATPPIVSFTVGNNDIFKNCTTYRVSTDCPNLYKDEGCSY